MGPSLLSTKQDTVTWGRGRWSTTQNPQLIQNTYKDLTSDLDTLYRGGSRGRVQGVRIPDPPEMTCGFLIQLVFCKIWRYVWCVFSAVYIMLLPSQKPAKAFFFVFAFKICLRHQSVTPFLNGAPPPKKNHGTAPALNALKDKLWP